MGEKLTDAQRRFLEAADGDRGGALAIHGLELLTQLELRRRGLIEKHGDGYYHTTIDGRAALQEHHNVD